MHHGSELTVVFIVSVALLAGAATRVFSRRIRVPYTIAMLLLGIGVGLAVRYLHLPGPEVIGHMLEQGAAISPHLIIFVFLPALVFESAFALDVYLFRKNLSIISTLAVPALVVTTVITAGLVVQLTRLSAIGWHWGWITALAFGALISATDPVAVVAILRELGAPKRLGVVIEGESLFNDGTSIVVFTVFLGILTGTATGFHPIEITLEFLKVVIGGVAIGFVLAALVARWISKTFNDPLVEITLTIILAYSAMILAEGMMHVSGVMAVVTAGLYMSEKGKVTISPEVHHFLHQFWELLSYIANTLIFYLVGLVIATQIQRAGLADVVMILAAYVGIMAIRFLVTFGFIPLFRQMGDPISTGEATVASWGGLRGAVSLALALVVSQHPDIPQMIREQVIVVTAGVVLLTILLNGSTIARVLHWFHFDEAPVAERVAQLTAIASVLGDVEAKIDSARQSRDLRTVIWTEVEEDLESRRTNLQDELRRAREELEQAPDIERTAGYWAQALEIERQAYWSSFATGTLGATAAQILDHEVELQLDNLAHGWLEPPESRVTTMISEGSSILDRLKREKNATPAASFGRLSLIYDLSRAEAHGASVVLEALEGLSEMDSSIQTLIRETYQRYLMGAKERLEDLRSHLPEVTTAIETRLAKRIELNFERDGYETLRKRGALSSEVAEHVIGSVSERMKRLRFEGKRFELASFGELCSGTPLYEALDETTQEKIDSLVKELVIPKGEILFREGDPPESMYIVARGAAHIVKVIAGEETILDILGGGEIIGEMALLTGDPRTATIRAATTLTLGQITRADFDRLIMQHPDMRERVWRAFTEREFDTFIRLHPKYHDIDREKRLEWIRNAEVATYAEDEILREGLVFLVTGKVMFHGVVLEAPMIFDSTGDNLQTAGDCRVAYL